MSQDLFYEDLVYEDLEKLETYMSVLKKWRVIGDLNVRIGNRILHWIKHHYNEKHINENGETPIDLCTCALVLTWERTTPISNKESTTSYGRTMNEEVQPTKYRIALYIQPKYWTQGTWPPLA